MNLKNTLLILSFCLSLLSNKVFAAPGDTTIVTVFDNLDINHYGGFDTIVKLPASTKQFQKVRLLYTLGRKSCPSATQYCGSWDYTTSVYAKNIDSTADSMELMRVVTPYATDWPLSRKFTYVEEVTDFTPILHDSVAFKYFYEGYSWGFTLTLKLEMIEGVAPRKAVSAKNIYVGHFNYGNSSDPIESHLVLKNEIYHSPTSTARIRNIITGHGMDNTGCGEFCSKWYEQYVNGTEVSHIQLWKSDCGMNDLYPQTGTWLFERANWCPGEKVNSYYHDLTNITSANNTFNVDMDMEPYSASTADVPPSYFISSQLITYEAPTYQLDAAITDIISPSDDPRHGRSNPICSDPIIKVRNEGATALTSLKIAYRVEGGQNAYYNWTGNLGFMEETEIDLGYGLILPANAPSNTFVAEIVEMNGQSSDETAWNNKYKSTFTTVPSYPASFRVNLKTNGSADANNPSYSETSWKILDANGNIVASRTNNNVNTNYIDTVNLSLGCYTFVVDDAGCDGIAWWYYPNYSTNPGNGYVRFQKATSNSIIKSFNGDFGCQLIQRFVVDGTTGIDENNDFSSNVKLYPNPTNGDITLSFPDEFNNLDYVVYDINGRILMSEENAGLQNNKLKISTNQLNSGMYFIKCTNIKSNLSPVVKKFFVEK